jgi:hypothetical protein
MQGSTYLSSCYWSHRRRVWHSRPSRDGHWPLYLAAENSRPSNQVSNMDQFSPWQFDGRINAHLPAKEIEWRSTSCRTWNSKLRFGHTSTAAAPAPWRHRWSPFLWRPRHSVHYGSSFVRARPQWLASTTVGSLRTQARLSSKYTRLPAPRETWPSCPATSIITSCIPLRGRF